MWRTFFSRTAVLNDICISRSFEGQLKMMNVQNDQADAKELELWEKRKNCSKNTVAEQTMSSETPLGSAVEFAKFEDRM